MTSVDADSGSDPTKILNVNEVDFASIDRSIPIPPGIPTILEVQAAVKKALSLYLEDAEPSDAELITVEVLQSVNLLHRAPDGYICFTKKEPSATNPKGEMPHMFSVRVSELQEWLPQLVPWLVKDSFFTLNSMYRGGRWDSKYVPGLPHGERNNGMVRYLTCNFVDCDRPGSPLQQQMWALTARLKAMQQGINVPEWSMMAHSGRGYWLFWLLRDNKSEPDAYHQSPHSRANPFRPMMKTVGMPVRCYSDGKQMAAWNRCQTQLLRAFSSVGSDPSAIDAARLARVGGSRNTKHGDERRVTYRVNYDDSLNVMNYTLEEMCARLNVEPPATRATRKVTPVDPKKSEAARRARIAMLTTRVSRLTNLAIHRGGIREGCRSNALLVLASTLRGLKLDGQDLRDALRTFSDKHMNPPLKRADIDNAMNGSKVTKKIRDEKIADWLSVTPEEAKLTGWPHRGFIRDPSLKGNSRAVKQNRHELIRSFVTKGGGELVSAAKVREHLESIGTYVQLRTVQQDLKQLGLFDD